MVRDGLLALWSFASAERSGQPNRHQIIRKIITIAHQNTLVCESDTGWYVIKDFKFPVSDYAHPRGFLGEISTLLYRVFR